MRNLSALAVLTSGLILISPTFSVRQPEPARMLSEFTRGWADDPVWFDGKAEIAEYDATRVIYGKPRHHTARIMTNKEHTDAFTQTKSADGKGRAVFKHHIREDTPIEKYVYHYSTMVYVGVDDFKSLKIDMGSQEDCGATFKQYINHQGLLTWNQFSYFPDQGHQSGKYEPPAGLVFHNALTLVLRGFPFDETMRGKPVQFYMLPDQTSNKWTSTEPVFITMRYRGEEELKLPYGKIKAHRITLHPPEPWPNRHPLAKEQLTTAWFASDPKLRHVLVQYQGTDGTTYRLKSLTRDAYWVD